MKKFIKLILGVILIFVVYWAIIRIINSSHRLIVNHRIVKESKEEIAEFHISDEEKKSFNYKHFCDDIIAFNNYDDFKYATEINDINQLIQVMSRCADSGESNLDQYISRMIDNIKSGTLRYPPDVYVGEEYVFLNLDAADAFVYAVYIGPEYRYVGDISISAWSHNNPYNSFFGAAVVLVGLTLCAITEIVFIVHILRSKKTPSKS